MLFSEPKISQFSEIVQLAEPGREFQCSSASRKFLNPGITRIPTPRASEPFQCSSASRKFLNRLASRCALGGRQVSVLFSEPKISQSPIWLNHAQPIKSFSALQRAENFSILTSSAASSVAGRVSVLFSEPKISQFIEIFQLLAAGHKFQCSSASRKFLNSLKSFSCWQRGTSFSALQRAENFSIGGG